MREPKRASGRRCAMMLAGTLLIGASVGVYRLSAFGADAYSCMNLGISGFLRLSFGTWQMMMNSIILIAMFFLARSSIHLGTFINLVGVGYLADFLCWLVQDALRFSMTLPLRVGALLLGSLSAGAGVAFYMAADMGIAPYDSIALMLQTLSRQRLTFRRARILGDLAAVAAGIFFCLLSGGDPWLIAGIGTLCNALFNGPLIQFFKTRLAEPLLRDSRPGL